jgi:high-affinity Fe2+/Pb2+ permease
MVGPREHEGVSMAAVNVERQTREVGGGRSFGAVRLSTETKQAFKTTEFWAMAALIVGILIASAIVGDGDNGNGGDQFPAVRAWLYIAIVGAAYMVSRGLAKAGSRDPYWADRDNSDDSR